MLSSAYSLSVLVLVVYKVFLFRPFVSWYGSPSAYFVLVCISVCFLSLAWFRLRYRVPHFSVVYALFISGAVSNATAVFANGGYMPVARGAVAELPVGYTWLSDSTVFPFLCDVLPLGLSIGDILMFGGVICLLILYITRPRLEES